MSTYDTMTTKDLKAEIKSRQDAGATLTVDKSASDAELRQALETDDNFHPLAPKPAEGSVTKTNEATVAEQAEANGAKRAPGQAQLQPSKTVTKSADKTKAAEEQRAAAPDDIPIAEKKQDDTAPPVVEEKDDDLGPNKRNQEAKKAEQATKEGSKSESDPRHSVFEAPDPANTPKALDRKGDSNLGGVPMSDEDEEPDYVHIDKRSVFVVGDEDTNFQAIAQRVGLTNWREIADANLRHDGTDLVTAGTHVVLPDGYSYKGVKGVTTK